MLKQVEIDELLEQLPQPVFLVKNNLVIAANRSARIRDITNGMLVSQMIAIGQAEYSEFKSGKLLLTIGINGILYNTVVTKSGEADMFCLESEYSRPELKTLSLAAQSLREPLTTAKISIENLLPEDAIQQSPDLLKQIQRLNKSIYQLQRAVGNMADADTLRSECSTRLQTYDANKAINEIVKKANSLLQHTSRHIIFNGLSSLTFCQMDRDKIERAVLNLISNAAKYASTDAPIKLSLRKGKDKLYISVENRGSIANTPLSGSLFSGFLREPSIENNGCGIGLGLTITHGIATAHKGTLLMEQLPDNTLRFTISIALKQSSNIGLSSPVMVPINDIGGIDRALIELSDVLPAELYE